MKQRLFSPKSCVKSVNPLGLGALLRCSFKDYFASFIPCKHLRRFLRICIFYEDNKTCRNSIFMKASRKFCSRTAKRYGYRKGICMKVGKYIAAQGFKKKRKISPIDVRTRHGRLPALRLTLFSLANYERTSRRETVTTF